MSDSNATLPPPLQPLTGWMAEIQTRLAAHESLKPIEPGPRRRAAVLIPLFVRDGQLWVLFTRRTDTVEHHRGQISFPGGGEEADDASPAQTALRETEEEIGLSRGDAIILGSLSPIATVTDFYIEPFVAAIPQPYVFRPEPAEIAEILEVPVRALLDPSILEKRSLPGREEPVLFYHHGSNVIWGATARMLAELLDIIG
jgi:8-oxo-dGTP pyrophosphatase MutT (NUDIX family)